MTMFTTPRFDISAPARAALKSFADNEKEIARTQAKGAERKARADKIILESLDDEARCAELPTLLAQVQAVPSVVANLEAREPALIAEVDHAAECAKRVLSIAQGRVEQAMEEIIDKALAPFLPEKDERKNATSDVLRNSVQWSDFYVNTTQGRTGQNVLNHADQVVADCEKFLDALKKHAALLPKKFYPLPETEADFLALCPPRPAKPTPSTAPEISGEERFKQIKRQQAAENFRSARSKGDQHEADRIWHGFMHHEDRAKIAHEECGEPLTLNEVDAVLKVNQGGHYTASLKAVQRAASERAAGLEKQMTASVE